MHTCGLCYIILKANDENKPKTFSLKISHRSTFLFHSDTFPCSVVFFFCIVFSTCYHWWICFLVWLLSSFFLFLLLFNFLFLIIKKFFYFNNFILFYVFLSSFPPSLPPSPEATTLNSLN